MILDKSVQSLGAVFSISPQDATWGSLAPVPKSILSVGVSSIDLKLDTMILDINLHNRLLPNFSVPQKALWDPLFENRFSFPIIGLMQLKRARVILDSLHNRSKPK